MLKRVFFCAATAALLVAACKPEEINPQTFLTDQAYVSFTNVSASNRGLNLFVDGARVNQNGVIGNNSTLLGTYFGVAPGSRSLAVRDTNSTTTIEYFAGSQNFEGGKSYAAFVYDTLSGGKLRALVLPTDRTPVPYEKAGIRFLNLVPNSQPVDLWLFRTVGTATDSTRLYAAVPFVGPNPNTTALATFLQVPAAQYTMRLRPAGANNNLATATVSLVDTRLYTVVARGLVGGSGGTALGLTTVSQ